MSNSTSSRGQQMTIAIPSGIPSPQFSLFQKVRLKHKSVPCGYSRVGTVTGLDYIGFRAALKDGIEMGWDVTVNWVDGVSEEAALDGREARETYGEECLELVEEAP